MTPLPTPPSIANPGTFNGLADAFLGALPNMVTEINGVAQAMTWNSTNSVSATSLVLATGTQILTVDTNKSYVIGMTVKIAATASGKNWMVGDVTAYNPTTGNMVVEIISVQGEWAGTDWTISQSSIGTINLLRKNDIVNGQFRIAQMGISFAAPINLAYDLDGWYLGKVTAAVVTISKQNSIIAGRSRRKVLVTTADTSIAATDYMIQVSCVEGYDSVKYINNTFTLGFTVRSSVPGVHCVAISNGASTFIAEYTINAANTDEIKQIIITGGTPSLITYTINTGLRFSWSNACGSNFQAAAGSWVTGTTLYGTSNQVNDLGTVGNEFSIENVTLNLGNIVLDDIKTVTDDLLLCQRYFSNGLSFLNVAAYAGNYFGHQVTFPTTMQKTAAVTINTAGYNNASAILANSYTDESFYAQAIATTTSLAAFNITYSASARLV